MQPALDTDALSHALQQALARRLDRRARRVLAHFASSGLPDLAAVDRARLAALVAPRLHAVITLSRRRDARVRHLALYALGRSGSARAVEPILRVLTHQRDWFDHDHAYLAAGALGEVALPRLRDRALRGADAERAAAVQCLGQSPCNTLPLLAEIARRTSPPPGFYSAVYNQHRPEGLALALPGLASRDPAVVLDALGAVSSCVDLAVEAARRPAIPAGVVARALQPLLADPRVWTEEHDPWASTFGWALETLTLLRHPLGRSMALRTLQSTTDAGRITQALEALRSYAATRSVLEAVRPFVRVRAAAQRKAALAVLARSPAPRARRLRRRRMVVA